MRLTAMRWVIAAIVVAVAFASGVGRALGIDVGPVSTPSVPSAPNLQPPSQLPSVPSVPSTPSVPSVPSTPSVPSVPSTPSVPHTPSVPSAPSTPSVPHTPATSGGGGSSSGSSSSAPASAGGGAPAATSSPSASAGAGAAAGAAGSRNARASRRASTSTSAARDQSPAARRQRYERRLRTRVKREQACLGSLAPTTRELLDLRAGISGVPRTRAEAAMQLGISGRSAAKLERSGLRALHVACGGRAAGVSGGGAGTTANARFVSLANGAPALQPADYLPFASGPDLQKPRGRAEVKGETATSSPAARNPLTPVSAAATGPSNHIVPWVIAACLAGLVALTLVALRRPAVPQQRRDPVRTAVVTSPVEPAPVPPEASAPPPLQEASTGWPGPSADAVRQTAITRRPPQPAESGPTRLARSASVVASAAASFAVRELVRRRRR